MTHCDRILDEAGRYTSLHFKEWIDSGMATNASIFSKTLVISFEEHAFFSNPSSMMGFFEA